jgi:membrane-associated protein
MESITEFLEWMLRLDDRLLELVDACGGWTYLVLFAIVFCETGLVITPFLPGDSLLFAAGALAGGGILNIGLVIVVLLIAAVLGDTVNYHIGHYLGPKVFREGRRSRWLRREHLDRTHAFFEKYGGKTIIIARFVPIVRTFAPFVAGVGAMTYSRFIVYNVAGAVLWVVSLSLAGYWFGGLEFVKQNFTVVIFAIIVISMLPGAWEWWMVRRARAAGAQARTQARNQARDQDRDRDHDQDRDRGRARGRDRKRDRGRDRKRDRERDRERGEVTSGESP